MVDVRSFGRAQPPSALLITWLSVDTKLELFYNDTFRALPDHAHELVVFAHMLTFAGVDRLHCNYSQGDSPPWAGCTTPMDLTYGTPIDCFRETVTFSLVCTLYNDSSTNRKVQLNGLLKYRHI